MSKANFYQNNYGKPALTGEVTSPEDFLFRIGMVVYGKLKKSKNRSNLSSPIADFLTKSKKLAYSGNNFTAVLLIEPSISDLASWFYEQIKISHSNKIVKSNIAFL